MRYLSSSFLALAVALVLAGASSAHAANLITNGNFNTTVPSNGTGGGWTSSNIDGAGGWKPSGGNPDAFFALNNGGSLITDPTIAQTVSGLTIGETYAVSGDYKVNILAGGSPLDSFEVLLDSAVLESFDAPGPVGTWAPFQTQFTATATTHTIAFAGEANGSDHDYGVDNIVVDLTNGGPVIPEPATLGLLTLSVLALRRR